MGIHTILTTAMLCFFFPLYGQEKKQSIMLDSVLVHGKQHNASLKTESDKGILWNMRMMNDMPKILGNADPMHYAQMLPGVQTNNEFNGGIHVQGSENEHNELSIAGVPLYNVNHLLGFFSTFNASHFSSMRLKESATDASFSNRLGAHISMLHEENAVDSIEGEMSVGLISSQGTIRLPLTSHSMLTCSGRASYINALYSQWLKTDENEVKYSFYDFNATYVNHLSPLHTLTFDAYLGKDHATMKEDNYHADIKDKWGNAMAAVHWSYKDREGTNAKATLYVTSYSNDFGITMAQEKYALHSSITDVGLKTELHKGFFSMGAEAILHNVNPQRVTSAGLLSIHNDDENHTEGWECSAFVNAKHRLTTNTLLQAGLRASTYASTSYRHGAANPSASVTQYIGNTRLFLSYAMRTQYLFQTGFSDMGLPTEFWFSANKNRAPQFSQGIELKAEVPLARRRYQVTATAYHKRLYNQIEYSGTVLDLANSNYHLNNNLLHGNGINYGFNIMLNKTAGQIKGWICYSYSKAHRTFTIDGVRDKYPANHDRTHEVNAVATYSPNSRWSFGATMVACSGTPFTAPECVYLLNGNIVTQMSRHNANRLETYARTDLSANYKWHSSGKREHGLNISLYNVLCHNNVLFHYVRLNKKKELYYKSVHFISPILPSISYYMKF